MVDAFINGDGTVTGIETNDQEARLRPKKVLNVKATDLHGHMFIAFSPSKEGKIALNVLVDGQAKRVFDHEYDGGFDIATKDLGQNYLVPIEYPAAKRTKGQHTIVVLVGKFVVTSKPGTFDFETLFESQQYLVNIIEGESVE